MAGKYVSFFKDIYGFMLKSVEMPPKQWSYPSIPLETSSGFKRETLPQSVVSGLQFVEKYLVLFS